MHVRTKKLIGTVALVLIVSIYCIFAVAVATVYLPPDNGWVHLAYFGLTGVLWVVPAMVIIKWMQGRPEDYEQR